MEMCINWRNMARFGAVMLRNGPICLNRWKVKEMLAKSHTLHARVIAFHMHTCLDVPYIKCFFFFFLFVGVAVVALRPVCPAEGNVCCVLLSLLR